jgi:pilus assembly protein CpaB
MTLRSVIVVILAIVCGLSAALGMNLVLGQRPLGQLQPVETVPVVVAKVEIPRGKLLSKDLVEVKNWPKALAPQGVLAKLADVQERSALQAFQPGEPVFNAKLATRGVIGGMASLIPAGKRAYTIQTKTAASNVAGFVLPGNLVDVLLTFRGTANDETGGGSTTTLLQAVEVLAVGKHIEAVGQVEQVDAQEIESVTLLVTAEQVARLDLGQTLGTLSLSLRNPTDRQEAETSPATIAQIRFKQMKPEEAALLAEAPLPATVAVEGLAQPPVAASDGLAPGSETKPESVTTSILTLRGQSWGMVRVNTPVTDQPPASHKPPATSPPLAEDPPAVDTSGTGP